MARGPTHPPSLQPGKTGSWLALRSTMSPSTCSRGSRAITSGSSGPCRGWAASRPSTQRDGPSRGLKRCCGCARALALPAAGRCASRTACSQSVSVSQRLTKCETGVGPAHPATYATVCDMCGRPLRSKRNLQERCGPWSGADMCAAFDAAHTPQARMGVRGSGPIQGHALEALVVKLVFQIPSLDRCAIPLL